LAQTIRFAKQARQTFGSLSADNVAAHPEKKRQSRRFPQDISQTVVNFEPSRRAGLVAIIVIHVSTISIGHGDVSPPAANNTASSQVAIEPRTFFEQVFELGCRHARGARCLSWTTKWPISFPLQQ
jgi:hypothetical protein